MQAVVEVFQGALLNTLKLLSSRMDSLDAFRT